METPKVEITVHAIPNKCSIDSQGYTPRLAEAYKAMEQRHRLWGWCEVKINARIGNFTSSAYATESSYEGEEDFRQEGGDFNDLKDEALANLEQNIRRAEETIAAYRAIHPKETP